MSQIAAADANREFSKLLRRVRDGETITVTSHGQAVAVISPANQKSGAGPGQDGAKAALLARLRAQETTGTTWSRDELYER